MKTFLNALLMAIGFSYGKLNKTTYKESIQIFLLSVFIKKTKKIQLLFVHFVFFAYRRMSFNLCNVFATFQRYKTHIFSDYSGKIMKVFMDDFSVYDTSFDNFLYIFLQRCEDQHLILN